MGAPNQNENLIWLEPVTFERSCQKQFYREATNFADCNNLFCFSKRVAEQITRITGSSLNFVVFAIYKQKCFNNYDVRHNLPFIVGKPSTFYSIIVQCVCGTWLLRKIFTQIIFNPIRHRPFHARQIHGMAKPIN